jgi:A/G-specific adenine glycosylase
LPRKRVGDFNQATMELGALVCTSTAPRCAECPLASICVARREGKQQSLPTKKPAPAIEEVREVAVVVRRRGEVLLLRRPALGRWANMWEFPHLPVQENETDSAAACRIVRDALGIRAAVGSELIAIRHQVTRFRITLVAMEAAYRSGIIRHTYHEESRWLSVLELGDYPVSSPQRLLAAAVAKSMRGRQLL